jgi:serine/threonine protein kinase
MTRAAACFAETQTSFQGTTHDSGVHRVAIGRGSLLGGRYKLTERLADGGMATVWGGVDLVGEREVVVKVLAVELLTHEEAVKRFVLEGDVIRAVTSKHIVAFIDHGVHAGAPYLVLERLDGEDLEHRLMTRRLSIAECATLLEQAALALLPAHARGIVHRDVKPANLFLAETAEGETLKLLDFGIAKLREGTRIRTASGQTVGSPEFMSPEQIEGKRDIDGRSDLFSLAGVAYACLTGRAPFLGETIVDVFHAVLRGSFAPPSTVVADLPPELDAFFERALAVDRADRFPNAAAMAAAFREIVDALDAADGPAPRSVRAAPRHIPIAPASPTQVLRTRQPRRLRDHHGLRSALLAAAALASVVGAWALAWS